MRPKDPSALVALVFLVLLGLGVRLANVVGSRFPLNDGGLFYTMIEELLANGLRLPTLSTYNAAQIPFAYPPLALELVAILHLALRVSVLDLLQYAPGILSAATIPAFYFLAVKMLESRQQAVLATLAFSLIPRSFDWLIMGGGITRALGLLFALIVIQLSYKRFAQHSTGTLLPTILFASLVVYTHPEAALHAVLAAAALYLWYDRSKAGLAHAAMVAGGVLLVTAPWWVTVMGQHGISPFVAAASAAQQDSESALGRILALFRFDFADEPFLGIFAVLGLLGFAGRAARRSYFLPVWFLLMLAVEPRGGALYMMIPLAMGAGSFLGTVVLPSLGQSAPPEDSSGKVIGAGSEWLSALLRSRQAQIFLGLLTVYGCLAAYATGWRIRQDYTLGGSDLQAMQWVRANTEAGSGFAVVTGGLPLRDATSEWFPALTDRRSIATVFGYEWIRGTEFSGRVRLYQALQECANQGPACIGAWAHDSGVAFDYVYLREPSAGNATSLAVLLDQSTDYTLAYNSTNVRIYRRLGAD